jgi:hypothetical protein
MVLRPQYWEARVIKKRCILLFVFAFGMQVYAEDMNFNFDVRPILSDKCYFCHGPDAKNRKSKLRLDTPEGAYKALKGGGHAVKPGSTRESQLFRRIYSSDSDEMMPPPEAKNPLNASEKTILKLWIEQGARYEKHWSLKPLPKTVAVPNAKGVDNPIDQFVADRLMQRRSKFGPPADRATLMRRVSFVLTGLPPTPDELKAFLGDKSPQAYEKLVDRLLKKDAYAERMAVDWLDLARYADSYGFQRDNDRDVTAWRDWVIRSFKKNTPYNQFLTEQLAGDLLPNPSQDQILATAFNRLHMQKNEGGTIEEEFRVEYVADRTQTAATAFLGLTFECMRCHDHKYDPLGTEDYYSFFAFFNNIDESGLYAFFTPHTPTPTLFLTDDNKRKQLADLAGKAAAAEKELGALRKTEQSKFAAWLKARPAKIDLKGVAGYFPLKAKGNKVKDLAGKWPDRLAISHEKAPVLNGDRGHGVGKIGPYNRANPFSLALWIKPNESYKRAVVLHRSRAWTDSASKGYELIIEDGQLSFALIHFYPGNAIRVRTKQKVTPGKWMHVAVTYDGSSKAAGQAIFVNGKRAEVTVIKDNLRKDINHGSSITLGQRFRDNGFKGGGVDELYVFDRALSEIEANYLAGGNALSKALKSPSSNAALFEYYLANASEAYKAGLKKLVQLRLAHNKLQNGVREIMVMQEMTLHKRQTYVLTRGSYEAPDLKRPVKAAGASVIYPYKKDLANNRLGLAKWLTDPQHPLTSRVAVNRFWQAVFGAGIVTTPNDFGRQGALPSHPELLDWLSRHFVDGGWNVQKLMKLMVMSKAFRQSSNVSAADRSADPANAWLARGPRFRLSAEMLRDNALAAAGLLTQKRGERSVSYSSRDRSLYVKWKRNNPPPGMLIFDAPRRQVCNVKRERTSTPLQALVLMNDPFYTAASGAIAVAVLKSQNQTEARVHQIFLRLCSRKADPAELKVLESLLKDQMAYFKENPKVVDRFLKAVRAGGHKDKAELAAWVVVSNAVMNLDASYTLR